VELLHLAWTHEVALHAGGAVAARPPLQRDHPVPRRGNVHAPAVLHAKVKTFVLEDIEFVKSMFFLTPWVGLVHCINQLRYALFTIKKPDVVKKQIKM
jgi:hypothetical protein